MSYELRVPRALQYLGLYLLLLFHMACGGSSRHQNPVPSGQPTFSHVILVVEENHSYSEVIGNASMPYLNRLASQYGLATQYYANGHPSIPNYLALTSGETETFDDNFSETIGDDNIVRELVKAGKSWKAYMESIPSAGYLGEVSGPYVRWHDPFSFLSDVQSSSAQAANIVDFSHLQSDLANNQLPQYSFIAPNIDDDAHTGTLAQADSWLQSNIAPVLSNANFQTSGLLIITFDEGDVSDINHGGGQVATLLIGSQVKKGFQSQTFYQHPSTLRLILECSGVDNFPGMADMAPDMIEFFNGH